MRHLSLTICLPFFEHWFCYISLLELCGISDLCSGAHVFVQWCACVCSGAQCLCSGAHACVCACSGAHVFVHAVVRMCLCMQWCVCVCAVVRMCLCLLVHAHLRVHVYSGAICLYMHVCYFGCVIIHARVKLNVLGALFASCES